VVRRRFDVNVLVYYLIDHPEFGDRAERWITDTRRDPQPLNEGGRKDDIEEVG